MWENRKLASWVVAFFCLHCTLTHTRKYCYGKCDFCHRKKTKCSKRVKIEKTGNLQTSWMSVWPAKTDYGSFFFFHITYVGWKKQKLNPIRSSSLRAQMNFFGCSGWISTNRGELKRNRCLQHSAWLSCCCATDVHTIYLCFLCQLVVLHFQHPAHEGCHEWLTLLFNYCFIYSERNPLLVTKKKKWTEEVKHASKSLLLKVTCCVFAALCDYWAWRTLRWQFNDSLAA